MLDTTTLKDFIAPAAALFGTVVGAFLNWLLSTLTECRRDSKARAEKRQDEQISLYVDIQITLEQAIKKATLGEVFDVDREVSDANARLRILAPLSLCEKYQLVGELLTSWSKLADLARPRSPAAFPDPSSGYVSSEREAYGKLQEAMRQLVNEMREAVNR